MVVVEYSCGEMQKITGLTKEKIVVGLTEMGAPTEEGENGRLLTELTPNRPDWYSMEGLARALKTYYGGAIPEYTVKKSGYVVLVEPGVWGIRPYTVCVVVKGLKLNDQRIRDIVLLQEKLNATLGRWVKKFGMGVYPLDAIAFPVKYTTMPPEEIRYRPLGYDREANAKEILEHHPKGIEYGYIIKKFERYPVFMDAKGRIMALIPIVNSAETGQVGVDTKEVFIEVTGNDMNAIVSALNILSCTLADMGGTVHSVEVRYPGRKVITPDLSAKKMRINVRNVGRLLGVEFGENEAVALLKRMGHSYKGGYAYVPAYRADVMHEVDVLEDMAIAYGYNRFEPSLPDFFNEGKPVQQHPGHEILRNMGFMEIKTTILTNKKKMELCGHDGKLREIINPAGGEFTAIRPNLIADMLGVMACNKMKALPQKFYEIGTTYENGRDRKMLVFGVRDTEVEFSAARGCLQTLMAEMEMEFELKKTENVIFEAEYGCTVLVGGKRQGVFGKARHGLLDNFGLGGVVYLCELEVG